MRQVQSLALLSGLRMRCCHKLWCRSQTWLRSALAVAVVLAGSYSFDSPPTQKPPHAKKEKKKKKKKTQKEFDI